MEPFALIARLRVRVASSGDAGEPEEEKYQNRLSTIYE